MVLKGNQQETRGAILGEPEKCTQKGVWHSFNTFIIESAKASDFDWAARLRSPASRNLCGLVDTITKPTTKMAVAQKTGDKMEPW